MSIYSVSIGGVAVTDADVSSEIEITHGRSDFYTSVATSSARITIYSRDVSVYKAIVGLSCVIKSTISVNHFTGTITDVQLRVDDATSGNTVTITAVSATALLGLRLVGATEYPAETVALRLARIFTDAGYLLADYTLQLSAEDLAIVTDLRPASVTTALDAIGDVTPGLSAFTYDDVDGQIVIQSVSWRATAGIVTASTSSGVLFAPVFGQTVQIVNQIKATYNTATQTVTVDNATSQASFGVRSATLATHFVSVTDATRAATQIIGRSRKPRWTIDEITILQDSPEVVLVVGQVYDVAVLPTGSPSTTYSGCVEGFAQRFSRGDQSTIVYLSDAALSGLALKWSAIPSTAAYRWNTVRAAAQWQDAYTLGDIKA